MDDLIDIKNTKILSSVLNDANVRKSIRLLVVFGMNASELLFVTNEDKCYAFGRNRYGCLGVGHLGFMPHLQRNKYLSNKQLVTFSAGFFNFCFALTSSGQLYGFGENKYGQLGVGHEEGCPIPTLVEGLADKVVTQISCGHLHAMALTSDGQLYAWGYNTLGQLGNKQYQCFCIPTQIAFGEKIVSISCGINHSLALTMSGQVFIWGLNESGQLGRPREDTVRHNRVRAVSNRPEAIPNFGNICIKKAVCGPNYTLLLSSDGLIYGFGCNDCGQVGNGSTGCQFSPIVIRKDIKFKDIVTHFENDLSIAVSMDDKYYVWGNCDNRLVLEPMKLSSTDPSLSLWNIYAKMAKNKITYKALVVGDYHSVIKTKGSSNQTMVPKTMSAMGENPNKLPVISSKVSPIGEKNISNGSENTMDFSFHKAMRKSVINSINNSFNNPLDFDIKFVFKDKKTIYCHKTILKLRNKKFWKVCEIRLNTGTDGEIKIESDCYKKFFAFIQYFYGIVPKIDNQLVNDLIIWSATYEEPELKHLCRQHMNGSINLQNVCFLYENAIQLNDKALEKSCIEFAANNWKSIFSSQEFQALDDSIAKQLMQLILKL